MFAFILTIFMCNSGIPPNLQQFISDIFRWLSLQKLRWWDSFWSLIVARYYTVVLVECNSYVVAWDQLNFQQIQPAHNSASCN